VARDESQACALELCAVKAIDNRAGKERQVGGVEVVPETGKRDALGADRASELGCALNHHDAPSCLCQAKRRNQAVVAGSDHNRVGVGHRFISADC
jgi:hypothetical protein